MKIAIFGSRGIPNRYGGFEELAEHLSVGLVESGYEVTVFNTHNHPYQKKAFKGVKIEHIYNPEDRLGTFGQFIYDLLTLLKIRKQGFDILLQLGYTSSSIFWWLHKKSTKVITNMDGLEWKRSKYPRPVQSFLKYAERLAIVHSHVLVADNKAIKNYLLDKSKVQTVFIPYGAHVFTNPDESILKRFHLKPNEYFLAIARMEPENHWQTILEGYVNSNSPYPFVVVSHLENKLGKHLKKRYENHPNIYFINAVYDKAATNNLRHFSRLYFHGHCVGGTNPTLLESMGCKALICAHDNPFNRSVLNNNALYFSNPTEVEKAIKTVETPEELEVFKKENLAAIREQYNWPLIIEQYELTFQTALR